MTEKKTGQKAPAKKPAAKAAAPKAEKKEAAPKSAKPEGKSAPKKEKPAYTGAKVKVIQFASPIGRTEDQYATLRGLGLGKLNRTRELPDTPEVRGMIYKIRHLVKVVG